MSAGAEPAASPSGRESPQESKGGPTVSELRAGQFLKGDFACCRKDRLVGKNGSPYLAIELRDRTGTIKARAFKGVDRLATCFEQGDLVRVTGRVERFRGELTVELADIRALGPEEGDPSSFLPSAYRDAEELEGFLEHLTREVHDEGLRNVVERVLFTGPTAADFRKAPCTRAGHHSYIGGLVEHTVALATLVLELCQLHPRLDSDMLLAAALVHDVGRSREFTYGADFGLTEEGRLLGHLTLGAQIVGEASNDLPDAKRTALLNCLLSHHGEPAGTGGGSRGFGSPEALALCRLNSLEIGVKGALERGIQLA